MHRSAVVPGWILAVALVAAGWCVPASAEKRVALVVGNSAYRQLKPLDNPRNDARLMADTLRALGFALVGDGAQLDLDKQAFDSVVQRFGVQVQGADVALFYYAGHGVQVRGSNYLVPVGANPTREADVDFQMVDAALVLRQMEGSGTRLNLLILDACRNNPLGERGLRAADGGLAQMRAPEGTLISYATQPGNVARDGDDGNSPYTKALAQTIRRAGLDVFQTFNEVGLAVKRATGGAQQPWVSSSPIDGNFYFAGAPPAGGVPSPPPAPVVAADEVAWSFVKDSRDIGELQRFVDRFPASGRHAEALARIAALKTEVGGAKPPTEPSQPGSARQEAQIGAKPILLGQFGKWGTYAGVAGGKKVCYAIAKPDSSEGNPGSAEREAPYIMVSNRPADQVSNEVSILIGYTFNGQTAATMQIGSANFNMYTQGNSAWVQNRADEVRLIDAMTSSKDVVVRGTSVQGARTVDRYSLNGLKQALDRATQECK
jgi:uncharacterized caspase-like protein